MKTEITIKSRTATIITIAFGAFLLGSIVYALCTGDLALLRTIGY